MTFPHKIYFPRDETTCELKSEIVENKIKMGVYVYVVAVPIDKGGTFLGTEIKFSEDRIKELLSKEIITITN